MTSDTAAGGRREGSDDPGTPAEGGDALFGSFVSAHLRTDSDRAVFWVLAGSESTIWNATTVAHEAEISDHEADQALRRFAAAGILERVDDVGRPRRYRWRAEMSYLHRGVTPTGVVDPVCGMPVRADTPHRAMAADGSEVSFCSLPCLVRWHHAHRRQGTTR